MKRLFQIAFASAALLASPTLADTDPQAIPEDCPLIGAQTGLTEACATLRVTFRSGLSDCMDDLDAKARARITDGTANGPHTNRARMLICEREVRERMGLAD